MTKDSQMGKNVDTWQQLTSLIYQKKTRHQGKAQTLGKQAV